ncbi:hypothetical protein LILAB_22925 [Corallococcus macrosporus]|uniref:Uncharacterized protein n=1 Tax=Myxococcus fulvus (strain ATCC BAA-855 / HW-1) TaxID=483219 RepID=F8CLF6_MYXFH|nr:hypothetical protein LILAB_22925 [Corallococcus macrosporus]
MWTWRFGTRPAAQGPSAAASRATFLAQGSAGTPATPSLVRPLTPRETARFASAVPGTCQVCGCVAPVTGTRVSDVGRPRPQGGPPVRVSMSPAAQMMRVTMPTP